MQLMLKLVRFGGLIEGAKAADEVVPAETGIRMHIAQHASRSGQ